MLATKAGGGGEGCRCRDHIYVHEFSRDEAVTMGYSAVADDDDMFDVNGAIVRFRGGVEDESGDGGRRRMRLVRGTINVDETALWRFMVRVWESKLGSGSDSKVCNGMKWEQSMFASRRNEGVSG